MSQAVEEYFQEKAEASSVIELEAGTLTFWKGAQSIPTMRAISFVDKQTQEEIIPNVDEETFAIFFKKLRPDLSEVEKVADLIRWASPFLRKSIDKMAPYLEVISSEWHKPESNASGDFEGFFNNYTKGVVEKIVISKDYEIEIAEVCEGLRI